MIRTPLWLDSLHAASRRYTRRQRAVTRFLLVVLAAEMIALTIYLALQ